MINNPFLRYGAVPPAKPPTPPPAGPTPCDQLAAAQEQLTALLSGRSVRSIETPQLGRVEFNASASIPDLQRLVLTLQQECNQYKGIYTARRRPISMEAEP